MLWRNSIGYRRHDLSNRNARNNLAVWGEIQARDKY